MRHGLSALYFNNPGRTSTVSAPCASHGQKGWQNGRPKEVAIALNNVYRTYGTGPGAHTALRGINLQIHKGTFTALVGSSGSGKTTLLHIVSGLDAPSSGSVLVDDRNLAHMTEPELADLRLRRMGFVFQDFNLVPVLTAAENVALPLLFRSEFSAAKRQERVAQLLETVGLQSRADLRPSQLSRGERQRVALARALAGNPALILTDEPTASLDRQTAAAVIELMCRLNRRQGTTFLAATHDALLVAAADFVLKLRDGELEENVTP